MCVKYLRKERRKLPPAGNQFGGIRKKEKKKKTRERERGGGRNGFYFFLFFVSLLDLRKSDHRISSDQKAKCSTQRGQRVDSSFEEF